MRWFFQFNVVVILFFFTACTNHKQSFRNLAELTDDFNKGELTNAIHGADLLLAFGNPDPVTTVKLKSLIDVANRIKADFSLTGRELDVILKRELRGYSVADSELWNRNNWLEFRVIDRKRYYFKRAVPNLKLILKSRNLLPVDDKTSDVQSAFCLDHTGKIVPLSRPDGRPVMPVKLKVNYQLKVKADAVPDGETVRCWLPWPHENHLRQSGVRLKNTFPSNYFIAPDSVEQRSIYLEQKSVKGKPLVFELQFEYVSRSQYFDLNNLQKHSGIRPPPNFSRYTAEQYPQIVFTQEIKHLADSIVAGATNEVEKVRRIYYWINDKIIWTGALEYSIIPFIPGYVLANQRGDCGMQTLLFMTMARYEQIPVKWQSGWMMHPGAVNLHDWCEVYYDGIGWVPLDMSFNLQKSTDIRLKEFYISGIDSYRLIVNDGIASSLVPEKKFARSEPYDFQRGEVEWKGGNLYFNQWDYQMDVKY